ncbi:hypothetical protein EW146_g4510 [Bondarzewia mesenterica]|uniref:ERCC1-like central domain-containing protein n=1 Tax=Bondarzewia mesenterica TaxID=1095465 RepID=A0A4S4LUB9_9AGAM|nr:hypothetical protein EW146_g4510 [Bondarzewia mesenterica]
MATSNLVAGASGSKPTKPPIVQPGSGNNIIINPRQRLNPVLECIRNVGKEFGEILPDFQVGKTTGVLFLSLRYHRLHPEYIHQRIEALGHTYNLRILLLIADEAGQYLSTYKQYERKPPDLIRERVEREPGAIMRAALTSISKVNKTDVETLRTSFGSFANISRATSDQLSQLPGFGPKKVTRMKDAFTHPFHISTGPTHDQSTSRTRQSLLSRSTPAQDTVAAPHKGKGKERATAELDPPPPSQPRTRTRLPRSPSPIWDIELDLNTPSPPAPQSPSEGPPPEHDEGRKRTVSPMWDIELDLSDEEALDPVQRERKRRKE